MPITPRRSPTWLPSSGAGFNRYDYLQNAPVEINGGAGVDTIVIVGTPIGDVFVVTDKYIAGAGRIVTFTNIEAIEVDGGGGPDQIYVLSTSSSFETTVIGGSGDDTIHIGGEPPPLVFDPPAYTYTPPAIRVPLPPEVVYTEQSLNLSGLSFTFELGVWQSFLSLFGLGPDVNQVARKILSDKVNAILKSKAASTPYFRSDGFDISQAQIQVSTRTVWRGWWFFSLPAPRWRFGLVIS